MRRNNTQKREQNANKIRGIRLFELPDRKKCYLVQWSIREDGARKTKTRGFETKEARRNFASQLKQNLRDYGAAGISIDPIRAARLLELEAQAGASIESIVEFYLAHHRPSPPLSAAAAIYLDEREGRFDETQQRLARQRIQTFTDAHPRLHLRQIEPQHCAQWLRSLEKTFAPTTVQNYRIAVAAFFNDAVKRGLIDRSPFDAVRKIPLPPNELPFYSAREALRFFRLNQADDPSLCGLVALAAFAGMRTSALLRIEAADIRSNPRGILTRAANQKRGRRYFVENYPSNLWPWLDLIAAPDFQLPEKTFYRRRRKAYARAGIPDKPNGWRHAFASHHSAAHGSADQTAYLLQHRSAALLYDTYKGNCSARDGRIYFQIRPR